MSEDDEKTTKEQVAALRTDGINLSEFTALKAHRQLAGPRVEPPTANLSAHLTVKRDFAGRRKMLQKHLRMLYGVTRPQSRWRPIEGFAAERRARNRVINPAPNIL